MAAELMVSSTMSNIIAQLQSVCDEILFRFIGSACTGLKTSKLTLPQALIDINGGRKQKLRAHMWTAIYTGENSCHRRCCVSK